MHTHTHTHTHTHAHILLQAFLQSHTLRHTVDIHTHAVHTLPDKLTILPLPLPLSLSLSLSLSLCLSLPLSHSRSPSRTLLRLSRPLSPSRPLSFCGLAYGAVLCVKHVSEKTELCILPCV